MAVSFCWKTPLRASQQVERGLSEKLLETAYICSQMSESKRIYQIDLFRFIAASAVVLYHYLYRGYASENILNMATWAWTYFLSSVVL
jgi:hypothetical protein